MTHEQELVFRPFTPEDRNFIENSWADSYYSACRIKDLLSPDDFFAFHRPLRARFFSRPNATVIIVASTDDPNHILGWVAVEILPNCALLHYIYVRFSYRKEFGLAAKLIERALPPGPVLFTHSTHKAVQILKSQPERFKHFRFLPHLT